MLSGKVSKMRKIWNPIKDFIKSELDINDTPKNPGVTGNTSNVTVKHNIISYYADYEERKYYEGFAKALIERCKGFGLDYDITEIESRGNYGDNCLMKPEFILEKLKQYKKPLIWMDCDTDFREPFDHFNEVTEDIGMATHTGNIEGIKASPLYLNYTKGAFRIIREWVIHCRECYDNGIVELDHDALKHYVLDTIKGSYSIYLLNNNWNDFVHGRYIWNGNSKVEGKVQTHRQVGVTDDVRRSYSQNAKTFKIIFKSETPEDFKSGLIFLDQFSDRSRINFIFKKKLLAESIDNDDFARLKIESGGLIYFDPSVLDSIEPGKSDIIIEATNVTSIEQDWDLKIISSIDTEQNPLDNLFFDSKEGGVRIKTYKKLWS